MQSALEKEIQRKLLDLGAWLRSHDRGVLFALLISIPPLPPLTILGLLLSLMNFWLWKSHRLESAEGSLIKFSILLSIATSVLGIFLMMHIFAFMQFIPSYFPLAISKFHGFIEFLRGLTGSAPLPHQAVQI